MGKCLSEFFVPDLDLAGVLFTGLLRGLADHRTTVKQKHCDYRRLRRTTPFFTFYLYIYLFI